MDTLEALSDEFDIADASGSELHIPCGAVVASAGRAALETFRDLLPRLEHSLDGGDVQFPAKDERVDLTEEFAAALSVSRRDAPLDEHLQFPFAGAGAVVIKRGGKRDGEIAELAFGAKTHVHAE